jgi:predicted methyltransferase
MIPSVVSRWARRAAALAAALALVACATQERAPEATAPPPDYAAIVAAPNRMEADRTNDKRRHPEKLLAFYDVRPGMRVLDMGATAGYNTELLARVVGEDGLVYAHNSPFFLENFVKGRLAERMKRGTMGNVVPLAREFDDPVPPDLRNLDLVTFNFVYHDTAHLGVDRAKMNRAIFNALKPGGVYIVADHSAKAGAGANETKSLHRIEESLVRREVEAAGFRYVGSGDFLRNPEDPRELSVFKNTVPNDEFVLKFVKPR